MRGTCSSSCPGKERKGSGRRAAGAAGTASTSYLHLPLLQAAARLLQLLQGQEDAGPSVQWTTVSLLPEFVWKLRTPWATNSLTVTVRRTICNALYQKSIWPITNPSVKEMWKSRAGHGKKQKRNTSNELWPLLMQRFPWFYLKISISKVLQTQRNKFFGGYNLFYISKIFLHAWC